jgi:hypothetical protein
MCWVLAKDEPACCSGFGFGEDEVRYFVLEGEDLITGMVTEDSIWVVMEIIHEHLCSFVAGFGGRGLVGAD